MDPARILIKDLAGTKAPFCGLDQVLLATTLAPWADILKIEHHSVAPGEIAPSAPEDFLIVQRLGSSGEIAHRIAGERWKRRIITCGNFDLVSAGTEISVRWTEPAEVMVVAIDPAFVAATITKEADTDHVEFRNPQGFKDAQIEHIVWALRTELSQGCPSGRLFGESLATALVVRIAKRFSVFGVEVPENRGGLPKPRLRRVLDYIHVHLLDDVTLDKLAVVAGLSPHHFSSLFKKSVGVTPHQYVIRQRIETAKHLLAEDRQSLADIAHRTGFPSQPHFSTAFRKVTGISPRAYRIHTAD